MFWSLIITCLVIVGFSGLVTKLYQVCAVQCSEGFVMITCNSGWS